MSKFQRGQSGNPGGKPKKKVRATVNGVEGEYTEFEVFAPLLDKAAQAMVDALESKTAPLSEKLRAAIYIADRVFGKPRQAMELTGEDGEPIKHEVTVEQVIAALPKVADEC